MAGRSLARYRPKPSMPLPKMSSQCIKASTHGLWAATAPLLTTEVLSGSTTADVAIVGAGYTGLSTAVHLREYGLSVVVLEAAEVGFGGSGRNVGLVNAGLWLPPKDVLAALGMTRGEALICELGSAPQAVFEIIQRYRIDCDAIRNGTLHCAVGSKGARELAARATQWRERGAPVELLSQESTAASVGSDAFVCSLLDRRAGTVQPLSYSRGLANVALRLGVRVHSRSAVERISRVGSKWKLSTPGGSAVADWIVLATDAYTSGPWRQVRQEQVAFPYFNFATTPLSPELLKDILPGRQGAWDTQTVLTSFRLDRSGRLIFGSIGALRGTGTALHRAFARRAIRTLFPQLSNIELEYAWYGTIGMTSDNIPRFHRFDDNIVGFSGYNGRGIAPGTAFGRILARHIAGKLRVEDIPLPLTEVRPRRLRHLREVTYEYGAQLAHLFASR